MRTLVLALALLALAPAAHAAVVPPPQLVASDPFPDTVAGQHATLAEPDNYAFGETIVSTYQVGRFTNGGASAIGWATSIDGGLTWRNGLLPSLTPFTSPPGPWSRVTDPAVAYDRVHGWWLISILALRDRPGGVVGDSAVITSRSKDGIVWEAPVTTSPAVGSFSQDKNWIVCDNGASSRFVGRCYTAWTQVAGGETLALSTSLDGGATWGAAVIAPPTVQRGNGIVPVVRPDGMLVMPYLGFNGGIYSVVSTDGGGSFGAATLVSTILQARPTGMRAPAIPSAEVDASGRVFVTWHTSSMQGGPTLLFLASTTNGVTWTAPTAVPTGVAPADRFLPGLGVDATTSGPGARLAIVYYSLGPFPCAVEVCRLRAELVYSSTAGRVWSDPVILSPQMELAWIANTTDGRMVGDYFSTAFVGGGVAVPIFAAAGPVQGFHFNQAMFSTRVPPLGATLRLSARAFTVRRQGLVVRASLRVRRSDALTSLAGARVTCVARVAGRGLTVVANRVSADTVLCAWRLPSPRARPVIGTVAVRLQAASLSRPFRLA
jgi:hypothetical protein